MTARVLTDAQQSAIDALYSGNKLLVAPKGFGKAVVGQTAAQELVADGELNRVLVLAPLKVCQLTWANEWKEWGHLDQPAMMLGDANSRLGWLHSPNAITVMNFENIEWLFEQFSNKSSKFPFDGLLVDESTKLKAAGGAGFKALRKHLKLFRWRCAMTADPVAEMGPDIYAQALLVDNGKALGRNLEAFRRKYFYPSDYQQRKWSILPGMDKGLADVLQDVLHVVRDDSYAASLPELVEKVVFVDMPADAWGVYNVLETGEYQGVEFRNGYSEPVADAYVVLADGAAAVKGKRQQVTAGAVYDSDGIARWLHTAKLDALAAIIAKAREPLAIAYQFQFELAALRERWPDIAVLGDNPEAVERDWTAGKIKLLAVHPKSCSHGLNLQYGGHRLVVLTAPWGADPWEQLIGRFRRRGQPSGFVERTVIVVNDTVDNEVLARHTLKAYASEALNSKF